MASSQGDVRSSPMAYPAVRSLPKLPQPLRPEAECLIVELLVRPVVHQAQSLVIALRSPATKRSSDLTLIDIHQIYSLSGRSQTRASLRSVDRGRRPSANEGPNLPAKEWQHYAWLHDEAPRHVDGSPCGGRHQALPTAGLRRSKAERLAF